MNLLIRSFVALTFTFSPLVSASDVWTQTANMQAQGSGIFADVTEATLSLSKTDDSADAPYTTITIEFSDVRHVLDITSIEEDQLGCTTYYASLARNPDDEFGGSHRFNVSLTDNRTCNAAENGVTWSATARDGYGWCGTGDSYAELTGTPEKL